MRLLVSAILAVAMATSLQVFASPGPDPDVVSAGKAFASGNLPEAERLYDKVSASPGVSTAVLVNAAAVKTRLGKIPESRELLRKAVSRDVDNKAAWLLLGMNALDRQEDEEAFADLARAVLLDPSNPRAHNYLGIAAGRKGWPEASETELRRAVELDSGYADANFNLAILYLGRKPPLAELARRHYQRALDLGTPKDPSVEKLLSNALATPNPSIP
jgi:tetratricopeptide (TPR) repeat protein